MIKVLLADAHLLFAEALSAALREDDISVIEDHPRTGLDLVKAALEHRPDVVVCDYWMEGMQGIAATRFILRRAPLSKVMLLSWFHTSREAQEAAASGASSFLPKSTEVEDLQEEIRRLHGAKDAAPAKPAGRSLPSKEPAGQAAWERVLSLTIREVELLALLSQHSIEEAAEILGVALGTLRNHLLSIRSKTETRTKLEAVELARRFGLI